MQQAKYILKGIWQLVINILLIACGLIQKIVLPGRSRKGNVLGSLFLFFIAIAEKIIAFEQNIFHSSWLIRNRFVRQGLIIATAFLFLVSSIEWTADPAIAVRTEKTETIQFHQIDKTAVHISTADRVRTLSQTTGEEFQYLPAFSPPLSKPVTLCFKRFLLLGNLRI